MGRKKSNKIGGEKNQIEKGKLYIVGTPIGNMKDITLRALDVLSKVDVILAEDTRQTQKLLNYYDIQNKLLSYHKFNEKEKLNEIVDMLKDEKSIALVSDAGMPILSDPGQPLVMKLVENDIPIETVPGPTALTTAIVYSNIPTETFVFEGFLPMNSRRRKERLQIISDESRTMIFYEAPHKLLATLKDLYKTVGNRKICLTRELTKLHEERKYTDIESLINEIEEAGIKGEIVFILEGKNLNHLDRVDEDSNKSNIELVKEYIKLGLSKNDAIKKVAKEKGVTKNEVYMECVNENEAYKKGYNYVCGVDEAGRGPLCGPVVAAAVILPKYAHIEGVNDSKKLSEKKREKLFDDIMENAVAVGIGMSDVDVIEKINILGATKEAMKEAISNLNIKPDYVLIDGNQDINIDIDRQTVVSGDARSESIAAASIIAKVTRDRMLKQYDEMYPKYGFAKHKGYGTKAHIEAIKEYGLTPIHRPSFCTKFVK